MQPTEFLNRWPQVRILPGVLRLVARTDTPTALHRLPQKAHTLGGKPIAYDESAARETKISHSGVESTRIDLATVRAHAASLDRRHWRLVALALGFAVLYGWIYMR